MTQGALQLHAGESLLPAAISPWLEMGAYEALWARHNMSVKKLAQLFRDHPARCRRTSPSRAKPRRWRPR